MLICFLTVILVMFPAAANACTPLAVAYVFPDPPGVSAAEELAAWRDKQKKRAIAQQDAADARAWRQHMRLLAREARGAAELPVGKLARDLAISLTPSVEAQRATSEGCGGLAGPLVLDPAGYANAPPSTADLVALGLAEHQADAELTDVRLLRDFTTLPACLPETREQVAAALLSKFSRQEIAAVWAMIHRSNFNRAVSERLEHSLLMFADGRSGPLVPNQLATANWMRSGVGNLTRQSEQRASLQNFLRTDPAVLAMARTIESRLQDRATLCPEAEAALQGHYARIRSAIAERKEQRVRRTRSAP